jgi:H+-transporting ATPase
MLTAAPLATLILVLSFTVFFAGRDLTYLPLAQLQTLIFVMLVYRPRQRLPGARMPPFLAIAAQQVADVRPLLWIWQWSA